MIPVSLVILKYFQVDDLIQMKISPQVSQSSRLYVFFTPANAVYLPVMMVVDLSNSVMFE
jgi:hypothetical protein